LRSRYCVDETLDAGGMGEVRAVWDEDLRRRLAMKVMHEVATGEPEEREAAEHALNRFLAEAQITAQLNHPGVVPVHEFGIDATGRVFFTMAEVEGDDLRKVFERCRAGTDGWSVPRGVDVLLRVAQTMAYAHSRGVIHRDLKPANVMVGAFGEVYVVDWGLARVQAGSPSDANLGEKLREHAQAVRTDRGEEVEADPDSPLKTFALFQPGTIFYMSPEQAAPRVSEIGTRSDVYALGAMLYELLSGRIPYHDPQRSQRREEVRAAILAGPPERIERLAPSAPPELVAVCEKAMAHDPLARYRGMRELEADLRAFLDRRVVPAYRTGPLVELQKRVQRNKLAAASIAFAVLSVVGGLATAGTVQAQAREKDRRMNVTLAGMNSTLAEKNHEAARLNRELTASLADLSLRAAELARQRGDWRKVLEHVDEAQEQGHSDPEELEMLRAEAFQALGESGEARLRLQSLIDANGPHRGAARLRLGEIRLGDWEGYESAIELLESARADDLRPVDREYALGLLEDDARRAVEHLDKALELDPFHYGALTMRLNLLLFAGRVADLHERLAAFEQLFPQDPTAPFLRGILLARDGDFAGARASFGRLEGELSPEASAALAGLVDVYEKLVGQATPSLYLGITEVKFTMPIWFQLAALLAQVQKASPALADLRHGLPNHPALRAGWGNVKKGLALVMQKRWEEAAPFFEEAARKSPEGNAFYYHASCVMNTDPAKFGGDIGRLRAAERIYTQAVETPSMIPGVARAARFWAVYSQALLIREGHDTHLKPAARLNLRWFLELDDPIEHELRMGSEFALWLGEVELARALAVRWQAGFPESQEAIGRRIGIERQLGNHATALRHADRLLELAPGDLEVKALRSEIAADVRTWYAAQDLGQ
jgi:serine/threonine protein kinase